MGTARLFCEEGARGLQNTAQVVERPMFRVFFFVAVGDDFVDGLIVSAAEAQPEGGGACQLNRMRIMACRRQQR